MFDGDLHICGTANAAQVALKQLRAVRASEFPDCIVIKEGKQELDQFRSHWHLAFGSLEPAEILSRAMELSCCVDPDAENQLFRGCLEDRKALKSIIKPHGLLVFMYISHAKIAGCSVIGNAETVNKFLQAATIPVGDRVQVEWPWRSREDPRLWEAIVAEVYDSGYKLTCPNDSWGPWFAHAFQVSRDLRMVHSHRMKSMRSLMDRNEKVLRSSMDGNEKVMLPSPPPARAKCPLPSESSSRNAAMYANTTEVPAQIGEAEAAEFAAIQQADFIERIAPLAFLGTAADEQLDEQEPVEHGTDTEANFEMNTEQIYLLEYHRHPEAFRKALCEGPSLQQCRAALEEAGCKWLLASGAKIFVHPQQYAQTLVAVVEQGFELRPFHVIVAESFDYYVEACLADLSYRQGARVKLRTVIHEVAAAADEGTVMPEEEWEEEVSNDSLVNEEQNIPLVIRKTFICAVSAAPRWRNPQSVTQSTTEVHSGGMNPRRICVPSLSD